MVCCSGITILFIFLLKNYISCEIYLFKSLGFYSVRKIKMLSFKKLFSRSISINIDNNYLKYPKFALKFIGIWPNNKIISFLSLIRVLFGIVIIFIACIAEWLYGLINLNNLPLALDAFCPASTKIVTAIKLLILLTQYDKVRNLIILTKDLIENGNFQFTSGGGCFFILFNLFFWQKLIQNQSG